MNSTANFITRYCSITEDELAIALAKFTPVEVAKGKNLLRPGQVCNQIFYIKKGTLRIYKNDSNDKEITAWLALEDTFALDSLSFYKQKRSDSYIEALSNCSLAAISYHHLEELYNTIPAFQEFGRRLAEHLATQAVERAISFQKDSAVSRYEQVIKKPEYMQNVLLKHLASFLGLTDTSLSRLRRRR